MSNYQPVVRRRSLVAATALYLAAARILSAQAAPLPDSSVASDEPLVMSPFVVDSSEDTGYQATSSLAGTRIKTDLKDVGSAISVVTSQFLQDTGATSNETLLQYTTNTEVGGLRGNFSNIGADLDETGLRLKPSTNTRVRGLAAADNTRDYFLTDIPWDGYNVDRVDMQRGPNAIMFGLGSPAGIINSSTNAASFKNSNKIETRYGSYDSNRVSADFNRVLLKDELAVRVSALNDETKFRQKPAFNHDKRLYGALRFDPAVLNTGSAHTSLRMNYEHGEITANRPRMMPPLDQITPWFTQMGKKTYDPVLAYDLDSTAPGAGAAQRGSPNYDPWLGAFGRVYDGSPMAVFQSPGSSTQDAYLLQSMPRGLLGIGPDSKVDGAIGGLPFSNLLGVKNYADYARDANLPNSNLGVYKNRTLTDPSIFDFYNNLIDGPNKGEWQGFDAYNIALSQTFLDDRIGLEAVYDNQRYHDGQESLLNSSAQAIGIDVNSKLADGSANPNVGRAYVSSDGHYGNSSNQSTREDVRVTAFGELRANDFLDRQSKLAQILGRHRFTGLYATDERNTEQRQWIRYAMDDVYGDAIGIPAIDNNGRNISVVSYLSPSLTGSSYTTASGLNLPALTAVQLPTGSTSIKYFNPTWNAPAVNPATVWTNPSTGDASTESENPANYVGWTSANAHVLSSANGDIDQLYYDGNKTKYEIRSRAFVWQGFLFDGNIVPTFGYREDSMTAYAVQAGEVARRYPQRSIDMSNPLYRIGDTPVAVNDGSSRSWSVVAHAPQFIREKLPFGSTLSVFFNQSENFQPSAGRVDILNQPLAPPQGETKDYGFLITTLDERISLKVNWYKTTVTNADISSSLNLYPIWAAESWGLTYARRYQSHYPDEGSSWAWDWGQYPNEWGTPEAARTAETASLNAWFANLPSDNFYKAWSIDTTSDRWKTDNLTGNAPVGLAATADTESKGIEFEFTAQATKDWSITANASKTTARRFNIGGTLKSWVDERWPVYQGPAGDVRLWWAGGTDTVRSFFQREFMSGYQLLQLMENSDVPELRPWHFNVVSNYNFSHGFLKGSNIGAAYRWQDRIVLGFPVVDGTYDINNPFTGASEGNIDLWVGYGRKLTHGVDWRIQLNVRNAFAKKELVPIYVEPDGTGAAYRIPDLTTWTLTNTFSF